VSRGGRIPSRPFRGEQAVVSGGLPEMPQERRRPNVRCRRGVWGGALAPLMQGAGEALHSPATLRRSGKDSGGANGGRAGPSAKSLRVPTQSRPRSETGRSPAVVCGHRPSGGEDLDFHGHRFQLRRNSVKTRCSRGCVRRCRGPASLGRHGRCHGNVATGLIPPIQVRTKEWYEKVL